MSSISAPALDSHDRLHSKYEIFDRTKLKIKPASERQHDFRAENVIDLETETPAFEHEDMSKLGDRLQKAKNRKAARILILGTHVFRAGINSHLIDLLEQGFVTHVAMSGAGAIHDYELARLGATDERMEMHLRSGESGLWAETSEVNTFVDEAAQHNLGLGENLGRRIHRSEYPYRQFSVLAAAYRMSIPATVHVGLGFDTTHEHPNCNGASYGAASYRDFLIFAHSLEKLEHGVSLNFGAPIMGPEVYLKALSMVRNVAAQQHRSVSKFTTAIFDVWPIRGDFMKEEDGSEPQFQPHRTMLVRTVADGGEAFYFQGEHRATLPALRKMLMDLDD